jgi:RNA polymerase sigma-70 factor (ECF subfamily)
MLPEIKGLFSVYRIAQSHVRAILQFPRNHVSLSTTDVSCWYGEKPVTFLPDSDLAAFEKIVAAHEAAVRAFVAVRIDDPFEAHDLAQEVFLLLWRKLEEIDLDQPLRPWLLAVAMNIVRRHRRKSRTNPVVGHDAVLELLHDRLDSGDVVDGPVFATLERCLSKLDEAARQLIRWRYEDGLAIREICQRVGSGHSVVTMKLHRLRSLLFDCIQADTQEASS